jgi:hypothetical protein
MFLEFGVTWLVSLITRLGVSKLMIISLHSSADRTLASGSDSRSSSTSMFYKHNGIDADPSSSRTKIIMHAVLSVYQVELVVPVEEIGRKSTGIVTRCVY